MSEKINEIVNREVNKELQRLRNNPNAQIFDRDEEGEDGEGEYDEQQEEDDVEA